MLTVRQFRFVRPWTGSCRQVLVLIIAAVTIFQSPPCGAAESVTATKDDNSVTHAQFSLLQAQTVEWSAFYQGSGNEGNDFYIHRSGQNLNDISLDQDLTSGNNSGTQALAAGTYHISIEYFAMGTGSYTIRYNLTASIGVEPSSHPFGSLFEGESSSPKEFSIGSTGDLPVRITGVISGDPAHFEILNAPVGQNVPGDKTFRVRFVAGNQIGNHGTNITISGVKASDNTPVPDVSVQVTGTTVALEPDIACSGGSCNSAKHLGSADHTVGEEKNFSYSFDNDGDKQLVVTSITLVNGAAGGPFSLSSSPSLAPVAPNGSRTVTIHFAPTAAGGENTYCGYLEIVSDDPDEPVKRCYFDATAHHPTPFMSLSTSFMDYHEVELGFSFRKALVISNEGDATLNLQITDQTSAAHQADFAHWEDLSSGISISRSVNPGQSTSLVWTYAPQALSVAPHELQLRVEGNNPSQAPVTVTLRGECIAPIPLDAVLVLDRSGSMGDRACEPRKIDALQTAASLFTDLLRPSIPESGFSDSIGYARYNNNYDVYLPLGSIGRPDHVAAAVDHLSDAAVSDVARLGPSGTTCIGGGMQTGASMFPPPTDERKHVMVVLTDGLENRTPYISDVIGGITSADPGLKIYSVGLGSDHDAAKLQSITNATNGYYQVTECLSGPTLYDLETFYAKILVNATEMQIISDPTVPVDLAAAGPVTVAVAPVVSSDHSAIFIVFDEEYLRPYYSLQLIDPNGQVIELGTTVGGVPVHKMQRYNYTIYRVVFPDISMAHTYVGEWVLLLTPKGTWDPAKFKATVANREVLQGQYNPYHGIAPVGFVAAVGSDYRMEARAKADSYVPGVDVKLSARLTDRGLPVADATVLVDVTTPSGATTPQITLYNDGTHGDVAPDDGTWSGVFQQTSEDGTYRFFFRAKGRNHRGELAVREAMQYVTLTAPDSDGKPTERPCIPCWLERLLWLLVILLLILIWWRLRRR